MKSKKLRITKVASKLIKKVIKLLKKKPNVTPIPAKNDLSPLPVPLVSVGIISRITMLIKTHSPKYPISDNPDPTVDKMNAP